MRTETLQPGKTAAALVARAYLRVSRDRGKSIPEQDAENTRWAAERGWSLHIGSYADRVGASRHSQGTRDGFPELMADLERGSFDADILLLWESSRGTRRTSEMLRLMELCEDHGILIAVKTDDRVYDMRNAGDRKTLRDAASHNEAASDETSHRVQRTRDAELLAGHVIGVAPYGYERVYDKKTRRPITQVEVESEAVVIRELVDRIIKGHRINHIVRDFAQRGITSRTGRPFEHSDISRMARNAQYAGYREHDGRLYDGCWKGIITAEQFHLVRERLGTPAVRVAGKTPRDGRAKHLLSGVIPCGVCGAPMGAKTRKGERVYGCTAKGCVSVNADDLDAYVTQWVLGALSHEDVYRRIVAREQNGNAKVTEIRTQIAALRDREARLTDQIRQGLAGLTDGLDLTDLTEARADVRKRLTELEGREKELSMPSALADLITPGEGVAKRWSAAPMSARRAVIRLMLTPEWIGPMTVIRTPTPRHKVPIESRVVWQRKRDYDALPYFEAA